MEESWGRRSWGDSEGIVRGRKEGEETSKGGRDFLCREGGFLSQDPGRRLREDFLELAPLYPTPAPCV